MFKMMIGLLFTLNLHATDFSTQAKYGFSECSKTESVRMGETEKAPYKISLNGFFVSKEKTFLCPSALFKAYPAGGVIMPLLAFENNKCIYTEDIGGSSIVGLRYTKAVYTCYIPVR